MSEEEIEGEISRKIKVKPGIVLNVHLHDKVRRQINDIRSDRRLRLFLSATAPLSVLASLIGYREGLRLFSSVMVVGAGMQLLDSNLINSDISHGTKRVAQLIKRHGLVKLDYRAAYAKHEAAVQNSFMIIDRRGNIHLIPKTRFQRALHRAQETFLKHVLPFRKRELV